MNIWSTSSPKGNYGSPENQQVKLLCVAETFSNDDSNTMGISPNGQGQLTPKSSLESYLAEIKTLPRYHSCPCSCCYCQD